jgi:Tfp pilus assembly protein PilF
VPPVGVPLLLLLLLVAVAQPAEPQPQYSLESYLRLAAAYGSADASPLGARERRAAAVHEIREWPPAVLRAAVADVQGRKLRASSASPDSVAIDTVEAAVLMHAEAGLLALRESVLDAAESHLKASATLFSWSRRAASEVRTQRESLLKVSKKSLGLDILQYDVRPRIDGGLFSMALAAGALAAGNPATARAFAEDALRRAPASPDAQLIFGAVAEGLDGTERNRRHEAAAKGWRAEARLAFATAISSEADALADPRLPPQPSPAGLEARLRLGRMALDDGRLADARRWLEEVDAKSGDGRQRHLAWLLLGRVAEREARTDEAIGFFRRALEACPTSQVTVLAWAHAVERSSGPAPAEPLVARALALREHSGPADDPWRSYLFGPPGLAEAAFASVRRKALGP